MRGHSISKGLFEEAQKIMPGGVSSPVRAFRSVGGTPPFISRALGSHIWDTDGNEYVDYVGSWGPAILGHAHPKVVAALKEAIELGLSFGAPIELETTLASMIKDAVPSIDMLRFVNSGTEATMSAVRLARGFTGRPKIVKFDGCYHGHADSLLVKAGSGAATCGVPTSAGVTESTAADTIVVGYNDIEGIDQIFDAWHGSIAAVIVEPVAGNMGCVPPLKGYLEKLRTLCSNAGSLLIFDEVMTGFRVAFGGAQELYKIKPDLTCLGKIVGGGLPVGVYGGRRDIMERVAPLGPVYQAGTLSGNPLAMTAGIKTIELLSVPGGYDELETKSERLCSKIGAVLAKHKIEHLINRVGSMWSVFFCDHIEDRMRNGTCGMSGLRRSPQTPARAFASSPHHVRLLNAANSHDAIHTTGSIPHPEVNNIVNFQDVLKCNVEKFKRMFHFLLDNGIYMAPSAFESAFVSLAHSDEDIIQTVEAFDTWAKKEG